MKKILHTATLTLLIFALIGYVPKARACSCIPPEPTGQAIEKADAVFAGRVTDVVPPANMTSSADKTKLTFEASHVWKGVVSKTISANTASSSASCGYNFEKGKEYIVYAMNSEDGLDVSLCSRTALLADASEDLSILGDLGKVEDSAPIGMNNLFIIGLPIIILLALAAGYYFYPRKKA